MLAAAVPATASGSKSNGDPFPGGVGYVIMSIQLLSDTGTETLPVLDGQATAVTAGNSLPTNASEGNVQTANSLPSGFEDGTAAYAQAQFIECWCLHQHAPPAQVTVGSANAS